MLFDSKKHPPTMSLGVKMLTKDVKNCKGIRSSSMGTCPSPFHSHVRIVPSSTVRYAFQAEMKSYGLAVLSSLAIIHPLPSTNAARGTGGWGRGTKAIVMATLPIKLP